MDLEAVLENQAAKYKQKFVVVHVLFDGPTSESFMVTKIAGGFPEYDCYDLQTFARMMSEKRPRRIGVANSPFGCVGEWVELAGAR